MREGLGGGHFYDTFKACPRKWYLKYIIGLKATTFAKALNYGSAVHEAFHEFYKDYQKDTLIGVTLTRLTEARDKYLKADDYVKDRQRAIDSLTEWYSHYGESDKETFEVVESETERVITLQNGLEFRIRPDRLLRERKTGKVFIFDTKTTGRGLTHMFTKTEQSDQPTCYTVGIEPIFKEDFGGWVTDCLYSRYSVHRSERSTPIIVDTYQKNLWEIGMMSEIEDLTNRYKLLLSGSYPPEYLFPPRKSACSVWGCPYSSVCSSKIEEGFNPVDYGFEQDEWTTNGYISALMSENIQNLKKDI